MSKAQAPAAQATTPRWDIFCSIVDNFGDIGVCWRLARQLAHEHGLQVRLWLDKPEVARQLIPSLNPALTRQIPGQYIAQVEICHWQLGADAEVTNAEVADVVIEAFACELPAPYLQHMQSRRPVWINLEYLSAESWVDEFHAGRSVHPSTGLSKHFFFPGFSNHTGGLLRESRLLAERMAFQQDAQLQAEFWQQLGVTPSLSENAIKLSLFCYPHAPLHSILQAMAEGEQEVDLFIPAGHIAEQTQAWVAQQAVAGFTAHKLKTHIIPFLSQPQYDRLLWACELNFVRGEDSWIRAIWAGRPLIWQPYFQQEDTHLEKLQAFLQRYHEKSSASLTAEIMAAHQAWNADGFKADGFNILQWQALCAILPQWQAHAQTYASELAEQEDLAAKLVIYCKNFF
ncbi:MAG: elongation factor P maturation arginine rhamnosyltransferase EarP [Methylobacillus glycogenes]|nr:elongation factor P maturation arginine rhamnosyltransferase EarP [Methylobacillus glycogenes]